MGVRWCATTALQHERALLVANGAGRRAAEAGMRSVLARHSVRAVVSTGFAGALTDSWHAGQILLARTVRHGGKVYSGRLPACPVPGGRVGSLLTVDRVVQSAREKRALASGGADAVDMEASAVAGVAAEHGLPFYCVRAISDGPSADLPVDFNRALNDDGSFSPWSVLRQAALRPSRWAGIIRLWRDGQSAARSLARGLARCDFRSTR